MKESTRRKMDVKVQLNLFIYDLLTLVMYYGLYDVAPHVSVDGD
jgi:hypothetical protein